MILASDFMFSACSDYTYLSCTVSIADFVGRGWCRFDGMLRSIQAAFELQGVEYDIQRSTALI